MRTTLTLDDDLARELRQAARRSGATFKETVNQALRRGLRQGGKPPPSPSRFRVQAKALGFRAGVDIRHLNQLYDTLESEAFAARVARRKRRAR